MSKFNSKQSNRKECSYIVVKPKNCLNNLTAILIFTQDISQDISRKMLTPKKNQGVNRLIFSQLNNLVKQISASTRLSVFHSNQLVLNQKGDFGKQLSAAIQIVFEKGFDKVICVGNDCPALNKVQILEAAQQLQTNDTVLGPDQRGGVYLLGISKSTFDAQTFENLAWHSEKMLESYTQNFAQQNILLLESLADIHTFQELQSYTSSRYFIRFLLQIIEKLFVKINVLQTYFLDSQVLSYASLRAPPVY